MNKTNKNEDPIFALLRDLEGKVHALELYTCGQPAAKRLRKECLGVIETVRTDAEKIIAESDRRTKLYHDECSRNNVTNGRMECMKCHKVKHVNDFTTADDCTQCFEKKNQKGKVA